MPRILILDPLAQEGLDMLAAAKPAGIEYEVKTGLKGNDLKKALSEADGAICRSGVTIDAAALEGNHRLKAIARAGVGTDTLTGIEQIRGSNFADVYIATGFNQGANPAPGTKLWAAL